jgi:hypothetical protein
LTLLLVVYLLLWLPPVQQKIKRFALNELMKITQNQISIGELRFRPFNQLKLKEVYVSDLKGDTLLFVGKLSTQFDLFQLLHNRLLIKSAELDDFTIKINKDSLNADFNFQFLIDAFASDNPSTTPSKLIIQINDIALKNGRLHYSVDTNHFYIYDFNADIQLKFKDLENLDASINRLTLKEKSGLDITHFQAKINSEGKKINLKNLLLNLPSSQISIPTAWLEEEKYEIQLEENWIRPEDVKAFYPDIAAFTDDFTFSGEIKGSFPEIQIPQFQMNSGNQIHLDIAASITDVNAWKNTPIKLRLNRFFITPNGLEKLTKFRLPVNIGAIHLSGTAEGKLPDLWLNLVAQTDRGTIQIGGRGGYDFNSKMTNFDAQLSSNRLDVERLLQDTLYGLASLQLNARGTIHSSRNINAIGNININRFDFNGYTYNRIQANGSYRGDNISLNLRSKDENVLLSLQAQANIGKIAPGAKLQANINHLYLDTLNFLSDYQGALLTSLVKLDMQGFNPEKMKVNLLIDSIFLYTDKGSFYEPNFKITYQAADSSKKQLTISSQIVKARSQGNFTYAGIMQSMQESFPVLFPVTPSRSKKKELLPENLNFIIGMKDLNSLSDILNLPRAMPDSALFIGKYNHDGKEMKLSASAYTLFSASDTLQLSVSLSNRENNLAVIFNVDNKSTTYDFDGSIDAEIEFISAQGQSIPDMNITLNPTVFVLNETAFDFNPAKIEIQKGRYTIYDLAVNHADNVNEYIKLNGTISADREDSIAVNVSQFSLGTIFGATKTDIPLSGIANGQIVARNLLSTPFIMSRGFAINAIEFADNPIGDLNIMSGWSSERNGLALRATLTQKDYPQSVISGFVLPERDSLSLTAKINAMQLKWLQNLTKGALFGLDGSLGADIRAYGKIRNPIINGTAYLNNAKIGITMLNTLYSVNDSISISPGTIDLKQFTVLDKNRRSLIADGKITHERFQEFNPNLSIRLDNFQLLDNQSQIDSLFYGNVRASGQLNLRRNQNNWVLSGNVSPNNNSNIMVNLPSSVTAQRHNSVTFINSEGEDLDALAQQRTGNNQAAAFSLPLRINLSLLLNPDLSLGAVFNPASGDNAQVTGTGAVNFSYDMRTAAMNLTGDYEIESGRTTFSLANIATRTFSIQKGGTLVFRGDPLATSFNLTALFNLRADLLSLDRSFGNIGLSSTIVSVTCLLTASGNVNNMNNMTLKYDILLPNEQEEVQRRVNNFLYTDDMKIRQMAYLLTFGTFLPPNLDGSTGNAILTSLGSSSLSNVLNNMLSGALGSNWSIGTDLSAGDSGFSDMDMDVNITTNFFNNRLVINGTVGYHNDPNQTTNFTGDFDIQYKLTPSGNIVVRIYNQTNNQYYDTAKTTQGVGLLYRRVARTFRNLFGTLFVVNKRR